MTFISLNDFINSLEADDDLVRISEFISPKLEIAEIAERVMKSKNGGKALLFTNTGSSFPILVNALGSEQRMLKVLNAHSYQAILDEIEQLLNLVLQTSNSSGFAKLKVLPSIAKLSSFFPKQKRGKANCQQVIHNNPDLNILPILKCWPHDGGKFITLPVVITQHPKTGVRNVGMYRMQVFDKNTTGMHWHIHKGGAAHFDAYKQEGKKMPVAVILGGDPIYTYCATAPLPEGIDEFLMAGYLRKKRVNLLKCLTQDISVPADADIVIEGYINPDEDFVTEGPFGDHTGFYSLADKYPQFHVTCITHRKDAVYPATIVGVPPMEDVEIARATEKIFLKPLQMIQPEILEMHLPPEGVAHNLVLLKIKTKYPGHALKVINAILGSGQMMFSKVLVALPPDVDIYDNKNLLQKILERVEIKKQVSIGKGPADVLDHSAYQFAYGGKLIVDATSNPKPITNASLQKIKTCDFIVSEKCSNLIACVFIDKAKLQAGTDVKSIIEEYYLTDVLPPLLIIYDSEFSSDNTEFMTWLVLSNIDPQTDIYVVDNTMIINATAKDYIHDGFSRDWPNIVAMDSNTINTIDEKWAKLGIGDFIKSPSIARQKMQLGDSAIYKPKK